MEGWQQAFPRDSVTILRNGDPPRPIAAPEIDDLAEIDRAASHDAVEIIGADRPTPEGVDPRQLAGVWQGHPWRTSRTIGRPRIGVDEQFEEQPLAQPRDLVCVPIVSCRLPRGERMPNVRARMAAPSSSDDVPGVT